MIIRPDWRILTIGDGDLSFSYSLAKYHPTQKLVASVYDHEDILRAKYQDHLFLDSLKQLDIEVHTGLDITKSESYKALLKNHQHQFDVVIFQFPLITGEDSYQAYLKDGNQISPNLLNRSLLRSFLLNSFKEFLDPDGERLCFITSKDVKPYIEWDIERSLTLKTNIQYLGKTPFDIEDFPEYKIRNVNRDKFVKDTAGHTFIWTDLTDLKPDSALSELALAPMTNYDHSEFCSICRSGPFTSEADCQLHLMTKKHAQLTQYHEDWLKFLDNEPVQ